MSSEQIDDFVNSIFTSYRETGFPFYNLSLEEQQTQIKKMNSYCEKNDILINGVLKQTMHCLNVAWSYFPHSWGVKCNDMITPIEAFEDDDKFKKVIKKRLQRGTYISDSGIRKELRTHTGVQGVSNFRPTSARALYDKYAGDGTVWDMTCGYGGRLLGAISSSRVKHYIGTEPDSRTHKGLLNIACNLGIDMKIEIHNTGSETFTPIKNTLDFCFTSPPYYNNEKYSNESTQSYIKYPKKEDWINKFLIKTISNCIIGLKTGGCIAINIANVKSYPTLTKDVLYRIDKTFTNLKLKDTLCYSLSAINKKGLKYEPIYVWEKVRD